MTDNMTYIEAVDYINTVGQKGSILGLGPITELMERLGNPQEKLNIIHVAGTNGKGSICTFLEMLYREEGKRVGRYISPTIHDYLERFQINGECMEEDDFARLLTKVDKAICKMREDGGGLPTAFEIETAIAFMYFVEQNVDIVILEVGMGGREDATNVIKHPLCTVFANIGMDHMQFLGDTIEKIAYEKAGIIKEGSPVICYPSKDMVLEVLKKEYVKVQKKYRYCTENVNINEKDEVFKDFRIADLSKLEIISENLIGSTFIYKGEEYNISLAGRYQIYNAITAIEAKLRLDGHLMKEALCKARWEGRFHKICDAPVFIKDGAHNVQGVTALRDSLKLHFTNATFIFIIGVLKDKEYNKMMELMCPMAEACYLIKPNNLRGLETNVLAEVVGRYCKDVTRCESVAEAVELATDRWREMTCKNINHSGTGDTNKLAYADKKENVIIVAWGSLSYIGEVVI